MKNYSARGRRRAGPTVSSHGVTSLVRGRRRAKDQAPSAVSFRSVGALTGLAVVATVAAAAALPLDQSGSQEAHAGRPQLQTSVKTWPIFAPSNEAEPTFSRPTTDSTAAAQQDTKVTPSAATQPTTGGDATERPAPMTTKFATDSGETAEPLTGAVGEATGAAKEKVAGATAAATDAAGKATGAATEAAAQATATATDAAKPTASPTADAAVPTSPATTPPVKQSARAVPDDAEPTRSGVRSKSAAPVEPAPTTEAADPEEQPSPKASPTADEPTRDAEKKKHRQNSDRTVDDAEWLWILLGEDESR